MGNSLKKTELSTLVTSAKTPPYRAGRGGSSMSVLSKKNIRERSCMMRRRCSHARRHTVFSAVRRSWSTSEANFDHETIDTGCSATVMMPSTSDTFALRGTRTMTVLEARRSGVLYFARSRIAIPSRSWTCRKSTPPSSPSITTRNVSSSLASSCKYSFFSVSPRSTLIDECDFRASWSSFFTVVDVRRFTASSNLPPPGTFGLDWRFINFGLLGRSIYFYWKNYHLLAK